jgi:hypothetical protein
MTHLPTRGRDWRLMGRTTRLVLTIPGYAVLALVGAFVGLTLFVFSLNLPLVGFAFSGDLLLAGRLTILAGLYPFVGSAYGLLQGGLLVLVALLLGVDLTLAAYHFREHGLSVRQGGSGALGLLFGTLGAGCAACGVPVLLGLLSILGVSTSLLFLPLEGLEFALIAVVALTLSIYWLSDGMRGGMINGCPVDF